MGRVVSKQVREIFQNTMGSGQAGGKVGGKDTGKGKGTGKASGKDKGKSKAKGKADVTKVLEVNLSGGDSGADVILFEVYDQSQGHERIAEFDAAMQETAGSTHEGPGSGAHREDPSIYNIEA